MAEGRLSEEQLKKLIDGYRQKLESAGIPVVKMYIYGSYAKGEAGDESDIDVCVISPEFEDRVEGSMTLMKLRDDNELLISPSAFSPDNFVDENPLAWEIKQTGKMV